MWLSVIIMSMDVEYGDKEMSGYEFRCKDIGMNCGFEARADKKEELIPVIQAHAKASHVINEISPELFAKVNAAIRKL